MREPVAKKQKLELTWVGKDERPKLEPRILIEDPNKSYHAKVRHSANDIFDNILIKGDNLLALKALEQDYAGKVKCIYIDPPYNTGSAFAEYEDGLEHSIWLNLFKQRTQLLRALLKDDGVLIVQLDDNEAHYAKVMLDEMFGRSNFVSNIIWQKSYAVRSNANFISSSHEHLLVFAKDIKRLKLNYFPRGKKQEDRYKNPDNDVRGPWQSVTMTISLIGGARGRQFAKTGKSDNIFEVISPSGKTFLPPQNRCWSRNPEGFNKLNDDNRIWWGKDGNSPPRMKMFLSEANKGIIPTSLWADGDDFGHNQDGVRELRKLSLPSFPTPKPEKLIRKILELSTDVGDIVLDSFAGSGTTAAVAQKMGRQFITIELGEHADTLIVPRLKKVTDGDDPGGISHAVEWKGGGGFRYYTLAPSLLETDKFGNWVISKDYNPAMLSEAMCKHMGFKYAPSQDEDEYWRHGHSTEADFIYVTTQNLTHDACKKLSDEVGEGRSLLICCKAYSANAEAFDNLTLVKIPTAILAKCEWGQDDYSLNVENLPMADALEEDEDSVDDLPLFAEGDNDA